jgi:hypothetical protein
MGTAKKSSRRVSQLCNCVDPPQRELWAQAGLTIRTNSAGSVWTCPNRPTFPTYEPDYNPFVIGYQHFGGIRTWQNPAGSFASRSPVKLSLAKPGWCLAADAMMKIDGTWDGGRDTSSVDMPQHSNKKGISSTARPTCLRRWMVTCGDGCGAGCQSDAAAPVKDWARRSHAGRMNGWPVVGC